VKISAPWGYVHKQFSDWSFSLFCFDAGISSLLTLPLGWALQMSWQRQVVIFAIALFTMTSAIFVYLNASQKRTKQAAQRLRVLAASIEIPGPITVQPARVAGPQSNPIWAAGTHLRAMFKPEIVNSYFLSLENDGNPQVISAKRFLEQLAESVSEADFRT
jgi:hypothetical protein